MAGSTPRQTDWREKRRWATLVRAYFLWSLALSVLVGDFIHYKAAALEEGTPASTSDPTGKGKGHLKVPRTGSGELPFFESVILGQVGGGGTEIPSLRTDQEAASIRTGVRGSPPAHDDGDADTDFIFANPISSTLLKYIMPSYWVEWPAGGKRKTQKWSNDEFCSVSRHLDQDCREYFDHIIIGCGAAGCPLARTLSEGGKKVLVIERGIERSYAKTPNCMDIYGCGRVIMDETVSQPVVTKQGVRTHLGMVMGGGTSLNKGIVVEEEPEFFEYLNKNFGYKWDIPRVYEAYNWVGKQIYFPAPQDRPFAKAWRKSLLARGYKPLMPPGQRYLGGPLPTNYRFRLGYVWGGGLFFNSREGFYRYATDTLLGRDKGKKRSGNLTVLTDRAVQRILFDHSSTGRPRAVCVLYRKTAFEDVQPLGAMYNGMTRKLGPKAGTYFMVKHAKKAEMYYARHNRAATRHVKKACVHMAGEITISAGAIQTPLLLFRSGIGSKQQLEEIGAPIVKVLPRVGQNLRDRLFIPLSFFSVIKQTDRAHYPTRICESIAAAKLGPDCRNFKIGDRSLKCTLAGAEALYGGRMTEGVILGSRYIFPPAFRHHPLVDKAVEIMTYCVHHRPLINHLHDYMPICATIEPLINCYRRGSAPFYFTSEPKGSGHVRMDRHGEVEVDFNYMKDEQDVFDAVRGMQNLLEAAKHPSWKDVLEPLSLKGCPVQILNGMLDLVATVAQKVYGELVHGPAFHAIRRDIGLLLPGNRTVNIGQQEEGFGVADTLVTDETLPQYKRILEHLQRKQDRIESLLRATEQTPLQRHPYRGQRSAQQQQPSQSQTLSSGGDSDVTAPSESLDSFSTKWTPEPLLGENFETQDDVLTAQPPETISEERTSIVSPPEDQILSPSQNSCADQSFAHGFIRTCPAKDPYEHFFPPTSDREQNSPPEQEDAERLLRDNEGIRKLRASLDPADFGRFWSNVLRPGTNSTQWLASYPPILPRTEYPEEVARYVFSFMTSLWHLHGTSEMGNVVDSDFNVIGIDNLSIVDASALTRVTRMNPTATLIMMGRYVGQKKLEAWQRRIPAPRVFKA